MSLTGERVARSIPSSWYAALMIHAVLFLCLAAAPLQGPRIPDPSPTNIDGWRDYILPRPEEALYEQIPWLPEFGAGLLAANDQDKPLLFWGMNGHPLGCT